MEVDNVKYDVDQGYTFTSWKDGGVLKCSFEHPYVLQLGVDEYGNDYFPQEAAQEAWYTGPAAAGQTLRWMYGAPYNLYSVDQAALYATYHSGDPDQDMYTADVRALLQTEKPVTTPSYAYNFTAQADDIEDVAIKRFIHWTDFNVQTYYPSGTGINEPHVPSLIVTADGTYGTQWETLRGFATSVDPCDESSVFTIPDMEVHGLWLNDPATSGLGYNVYLTGDEFKAVYEPVDGKYRSVCEPPEDIDVALLEASLQAAEIKYEKGKPNVELKDALTVENKLFSTPKSAEKLNAQLMEIEPIAREAFGDVFKKVNWDEVIPVSLLNSADFRYIYTNTAINGTMNVVDLDTTEAYTLVLFSQSGAADTASMVLMVDKESGLFRQASWTLEDHRYLSEDEALKIAGKALGCPRKAEVISSSEEKTLSAKPKPFPICDMTDWKIRHIWAKKYGRSRFQPIYEVAVSSEQTVYVLQDGSFFIEGELLQQSPSLISRQLD
jgi:hypothetical protein